MKPAERTEEMNKKHTKNALEMWAELMGYNRGSSLGCDKTKGYHFHDESWTCYPAPNINHPFLFTIIKGMDAVDKTAYKNKLREVVTYDIENQDLEIDMLTPSVDDILEALYEATK